jgi:hypothetical protein
LKYDCDLQSNFFHSCKLTQIKVVDFLKRFDIMDVIFKVELSLEVFTDPLSSRKRLPCYLLPSLYVAAFVRRTTSSTDLHPLLKRNLYFLWIFITLYYSLAKIMIATSKKWSPVSLDEYISTSSEENISINVNMWIFTVDQLVSYFNWNIPVTYKTIFFTRAN